jgi:hypothetical protein
MRRAHYGLTTRDGRADANAWKAFGFDLDAHNTCSISDTFGCIRRKTPTFEGPNGIDNAFAPEVLSAFRGLKADFEETQFWADYTILLRLDDFGGPSDSSVPGALYIARGLEGAGEPLWTSADRWIIDANSLVDGVSIDQPRWRFANGFTKDGVWWSGGSTATTFPFDVMLYREPQTFPVRIHVLKVALDTRAVDLGGTVSVADPQISVIDRQLATCGVFARLLTDAADLVESDPGLQRAGVLCDAVSVGLGFEAVDANVATAAQKFSPPSPLRSTDVCSPEGSPPAPCTTCDPQPRMPIHGVAADGRVDITAAEAWPMRPTEPAPLSRDDLARACVTLAACLYVDDVSSAFDLNVARGRAWFAQSCANPGPSDDVGSLFGEGAGRSEEYVIPLSHTANRLPWLSQAALAAKGDCAKVLATRSARPAPLVCASHGCWWKDLSTSVKCSGSVATIVGSTATYTRDCSHSLTTCDPTSVTGCADRPIISCDPVAGDRCDGNIKLGCRKTGFLSYRDCSWYGGKCVEDPGGKAHCQYAASCPDREPTCTGTTLHLCTLGEPISVDCVELGFSGCDRGRCYR